MSQASVTKLFTSVENLRIDIETLIRLMFDDLGLSSNPDKDLFFEDVKIIEERLTYLNGIFMVYESEYILVVQLLKDLFINVEDEGLANEISRNIISLDLLLYYAEGVLLYMYDYFDEWEEDASGFY